MRSGYSSQHPQGTLAGGSTALHGTQRSEQSTLTHINGVGELTRSNSQARPMQSERQASSVICERVHVAGVSGAVSGCAAFGRRLITIY
eukprot:1195496-Prorocentrum_minimum.AAC.3